MKKNLFAIILIFGVSLWALKSLFGGPYYTSQDGIHQVARLYHFKEALKDGVFPPRWANQAFYGYGYPLFEFNYHFPWYVSIPFIALRFGIFDIIKILHFIAYFLSGFFMYYFLRLLTKNKFAAFLGSVLFLVSPYRFVNIYVRNATGEVFAMMFFPLIFYAMLKISKELKLKFCVLLSISMTGVILSHAFSFLIFLPSILTFFIYLFFTTTNKKKFITQLAISGILFLLLSAYYLFPALIEKSYTIFDSKFKDIYTRELLDLKRIIYSSWGYSGNGNLPQNVMSFQFGIPNWIATLMGVVGLVILMIKKQREKMFFVAICILSIIFSIFLSINQSLFLWQIAAKFFTIDFPWKFIGIAVFWASILFGFLFSLTSSKIKYFFAIIFLALIIYANRNHINVNKYVSFDIPSAVFFEKSTNTEDEYLPHWVSTFDFKNEKNINIKLESRIEIVKKGIVSGVKDKNQSFSFAYNGPGTKATVKKIYFPGWIVMENNKKINFNFSNGFFNFVLPKGKTDVKLIYEGTGLVKVSNVLSFIAFVLIGIYFLFQCAFYAKHKSKKFN